MFEDIKEAVWNIIKSRIFLLMTVFVVMFAILLQRVFYLQIVKGEEYQDTFSLMTEREISLTSTRGDIYDCNGYLLAYNEPAYSVTIQDIGAYPDSASMNAMLLRLVRILKKHGCSIQGKLEIGLDESGRMIYTSSSESARLRFLREDRKSVV